MIKLKDALITQGLPVILGEQSRVQALAYALQKQVGKILALEDCARIYASISQIKEAAIDCIALEMRIPQYSDEMPLSTKKAMVINGLTYWSRMGTVGALEQLCQDLFQSAECTEWFDYDGDPGHFRITTDNKKITDADVEYFKSAVESVKRLSAWLDEIELVMGPDMMEQCSCFGVFTSTDLNLVCDGKVVIKPTVIGQLSSEGTMNLYQQRVIKLEVEN